MRIVPLHANDACDECPHANLRDHETQTVDDAPARIRFLLGTDGSTPQSYFDLCVRHFVHLRRQMDRYEHQHFIPPLEKDDVG